MIINGEGRFILMDKPMASPFSDIVTGTPEGPVFDLSVDLEYYSGVGYLKVEHVEEMAHTLGMITKVEADALLRRIEELNAEVLNIPREVESLKDGLSELVADFLNRVVPRNGDSGLSVPVYLQDIDPGTEGGKGNESEPDSTDSSKSVAGDSDSSAGKDSKPSLSKGPAKLSSSAGNGLEF